MAQKIFVAATGQHCGKTTVSVGLVHQAVRQGRRVGFMKPVGQQHVQVGDRDVDKDAALIAAVYGLEDDLPYMSPVVLKSDATRRAIDGEISAGRLAEQILAASHELEKKVDLLVYEGTGHGGVGSVMGLNNAQVAKLLEAPVVIVAEGGIGNTVDRVVLNHALYKEAGASVRGVIVNKLLPDKRAESLKYVDRCLRERGLKVLPGFDYSSVLAQPSMSSVSRFLGVPLHGDATAAHRIALHIQLGAASTQRVVDLLRESTLLVNTGSRDELMVTISALYNIPEFHERICGLVITGLAPISPITQRILEDSNLPFMRVESPSGEVFQRLQEHVAKLTPDDEQKLKLVQREAERTLDLAMFDEMIR